ncbi:hypothetical protein [Mycobacterium ostraviense]|nr:hypothetical protein [Mycobacterium ostraviense]
MFDDYATVVPPETPEEQLPYVRARQLLSNNAAKRWVQRAS